MAGSRRELKERNVALGLVPRLVPAPPTSVVIPAEAGIQGVWVAPMTPEHFHPSAAPKSPYLGLPAPAGMGDWNESMSRTLIRDRWLLSRPRAWPNLQGVGLSHAWFPPRSCVSVIPRARVNPVSGRLSRPLGTGRISGPSLVHHVTLHFRPDGRLHHLHSVCVGHRLRHAGLRQRKLFLHEIPGILVDRSMKHVYR